MDNQVYIGGDEFVFNVNENGQHIGGGFSIPSIMTKMGMSPIMTVNVNDTSQMSGGGNQVSDLFKNTAVPSWATMYRMHGGEYTEYDKNNKNDKGQIKKKKKNVKKSKGNDNDSDNDSDSDSDSNSNSNSISDNDSDSDSVVSDGLHDKLLELAKEQDNKIRKIKRKNTKKNKDREKKERNTTKKQSKEKQ
jgi:hypothetical protein